MVHLPELIKDLALILMAAAIVVLIFKKIKQPLVLGYIIAGFIVGPHFHLFPTIVGGENVKTLAEIGVIFLLFGLGLEFSFKKLMHVGATATVTAFIEIFFITITGYITGKMLGWSTMDSLFLGGMLASSSTTIIIRAFDELGVKTKQFAKTVFGVLVVEDIVVILLMVLLSTIAVTNKIEGSQILYTILKLIFFLILWFVMGIFLLPSLLKRVKLLFDEEILLVLSIGLCLGMVLLATKVGFSAELGAFIMGSIIAETVFAEKIEHILKPVKDLFGAIFFVSVGIMIDPAAIMTYGFPILIITLLTVFGKAFSSGIGALVSGQTLSHSVQVGMSMAQIGEFAFIVATLGLSLGVISDFLFPVAVGVSAVTTFVTPYMIKLSDPSIMWLEKNLPERWLVSIQKYSSRVQTVQTENSWKILLKHTTRVMLINGTIIFSIIWVYSKYVNPIIDRQIDNEVLRNIINLILPLLFCLPFIWAFLAKKIETPEIKNNDQRGYNLIFFDVMRFVLGVTFLVLIVDHLSRSVWAYAIGIPVCIALIYFFSRRIQKLYQNFENRFISNLNDRQNTEKQNPFKYQAKKITEKLAVWDVHIVELEVSPQAIYLGRSLLDLAWREKYGVNIGYIRRGEKIITNPNRYEVLYPYDKVGIIATDEQIKNFKPIFDQAEEVVAIEDIESIQVNKIIIDEQSSLCGKQLKDSGLRENTGGLVVAIFRGNDKLLNPESSTRLQADDIVWVVGNKVRIENYRIQMSQG